MTKHASPTNGDDRELPQSSLPRVQVTLYPAWCKRCGNCVAFCPRKVFETDQWGYPRVAHPERCVSCHLCEMLCPDFALSVGEHAPRRSASQSSAERAPAVPASHISPEQSPERTAPEPNGEEHDRDQE